ncbi:dihydroorotase [Rhodovibrio salinarum]|uniref:Dihydroorotase n=1 Tax=Rhodovibrio salinarum TaxID=1087 RepID=A0A934QF10_9PROT|nr:dihydroorotase [Rhodovibrio salinarum]MBK1695679.1 dihydroorotase [Rhodovibrio salinarum]
MSLHAKPAGTTKVAYTNARLLDPASGLDTQGGVLVDGNRIAEIGPGLFRDGLPEAVQEVDCGGLCLAPGLVDMRAQLGEPGREHKETISSAGRAAASAGITSLACLPNTDPVIDDVAGLEFVARRARETKMVKVYAYGALTRGCAGEQMTEIGLLSEAGAVGFTDGNRTIANAQTLRRCLSYASVFDTVILQHPLEPTLATGAMNGGALATRLGLSGSPAMAELIQVERDLRLVEMTGGRYHASLITTAAAVEAIRQAKAKGLQVTCDTAPHYFTLTEDAVGDYRTFAKVDPPLRREADRQALIAGLADGTIDAIVSDHNPQDQDSKRLPFAAAADGIAGLETLFALSLKLAHTDQVDLLDLLARVTCKPADILGLDAGRLRAGDSADMILFDPAQTWTIDPDGFLGKCKNSPFDAWPARGRVLRTIVDGRTIYAETPATAAA